MNPTLERKLEQLRSDYCEVNGSPFSHFYCPVLFRDEDVELCRAHIINRAFPESSRRWIVQRADVDNFYGSHFESDFTDIRYAGSSAEQVFADPQLRKHFRPKLIRRNESVDYFELNGPLPSNYSAALLRGGETELRLGLKTAPGAVEDSEEKWSIEWEKDVRIPALVSVLKAAHLALFEMLGYRYALSSGGQFIGWTVLGNFFLQNRGLPKAEVKHNANQYFSQYANLVRPVLTSPTDVQDAVNDRFLFICGSITRWAFIVFLKTADSVHAAVIPVLETADASDRFVSFLNGDGGSIHARQCWFKGDKYELAPGQQTFMWPKANLL